MRPRAARRSSDQATNVPVGLGQRLEASKVLGIKAADDFSRLLSQSRIALVSDRRPFHAGGPRLYFEELNGRANAAKRQRRGRHQRVDELVIVRVDFQKLLV